MFYHVVCMEYTNESSSRLKGLFQGSRCGVNNSSLSSYGASDLVGVLNVVMIFRWTAIVWQSRAKFV